MARDERQRAESVAGVGRAVIPSPAGSVLGAYGRDGPCEGVLDELSVTALLLKSADATALWILSVDCLAPLPSEATAMRRAAAGHVQPSGVLLCYTHTHSAPELTESYVDAIVHAVDTACASAARALRPVEVGWGCGRTDALVNRRALPWRVDQTLRPSGPGRVDDRIGVLVVRETGGGPLAALLWCGVHGNVLTRENNRVSADWPGAVRARVEPALGCPVLVALGGAGNVDPRWRGGPEALARMGAALGDEVLSVANGVATRPLEVLRTRSRVVDLRLQPLPEAAAARELQARIGGCQGRSPWLDAVLQRRARGELEPVLPLEIQVVRIHEGVLGGIPMEPFAEMSLSVAGRTRRGRVFFGGYMNGWWGYLPTPEEMAAGGYEVDEMPVRYGWISGMLTPPVRTSMAHIEDAAVEMIGQVLAEERDPGA